MCKGSEFNPCVPYPYSDKETDTIAETMLELYITNDREDKHTLIRVLLEEVILLHCDDDTSIHEEITFLEKICYEWLDNNPSYADDKIPVEEYWIKEEYEKKRYEQYLDDRFYGYIHYNK